jgi:hypothetical protein
MVFELPVHLSEGSSKRVHQVLRSAGNVLLQQLVRHRVMNFIDW